MVLALPVNTALALEDEACRLEEKREVVLGAGRVIK